MVLVDRLAGRAEWPAPAPIFYNKGHLVVLTDRSKHLFSLMAPVQPTKATTMVMDPTMMSMLATEREGRLESKTPTLFMLSM